MFAGLTSDVFCKLDAIRYQVANLIHCAILTTPKTNHEQIQNGNIASRPTDAFVQTAIAVLSIATAVFGKLQLQFSTATPQKCDFTGVFTVS